MRTMQLQLDHADAVRRATGLAFAALASLMLVIPATARADDSDDKSEKRTRASGPRQESSAGSSGNASTAASDEELAAIGVDGSFVLHVHEVSMTGGPMGAGSGLTSNRQWRKAGVFGAVASGAMLFTQFNGSAPRSATPAAARTSPGNSLPDNATPGSTMPGLDEALGPNASVTAPEPGTVALLAAGLGALGLLVRRRRGGTGRQEHGL